MAINERLVHTASAAAAGTGNQEEGLILHLDANDVDSYDGDGDIWYDIHDHEYTPATNVSEHFNTVIWSGDGTLTRSITGVGFQPDLVWIKTRSNAVHHTLHDSVRGAGTSGTNKAIFSSASSTENTGDADVYGFVSAFDSDGFELTGGSASNTSDKTIYNNRSSNDYVAWCFNAGDDQVTNTEGTIDSTVRANNNLGFSIATYTGVGYPNSTTAEIGHGLDSAPELVIIKGIGGTGQSGGAGSWVVGSSLLGNGWDGGMYLNSTGAYYNAVNYFWNGAATGTVIKLKNDWFVNGANNNYVAYSFTSKRGVSKVSSYVGDGTTNNKIYTGFEPAFIIIKRTDSTSNWRIYDNTRGTQKELYANDTAQEPSDVSYITFNRDGFTLTSNGGWINNSGGKFIYYAVAKNTNETKLADTVGFKPSIDPDDHFNTVTYTGSGDTTNGQSITGVGFQPDLVWMKSTGTTYNHVIYDSIRGVDSAISSNLNDAAWSNLNRFESFDSDGFTIEADNNADLWKIDRSGEPYVAWCFNAGGNEVTDTYGTVNSTVRANNDLGFSIVKYTGAASATVGHGLSVTPELIITKNLGNSSAVWATYSVALGKDKLIELNSTSAAQSVSNYWGTSSPTSYVFGLSTNSAHYNANGSQIAYCFASKRGVSKVGSYTGTGTSGNKIFTEFEPAFVMVKNTDDAGGWLILDNVRDTDGILNEHLYANTSAQEVSASTATITPNRDGFTIGNSNSIHLNRSGDTFIYYAVAKNTNNEGPHLELNLKADSYSGSGDWLDSSGNGNNGTITGAIHNDELGDFFEFNGSSDKVNITSTATTPIDFTAKNYTIEAWINPDTSGVNQIFTKYGSSDSLRSISVMVHSDNTLRLLQRTSTSDNSYSTSTIPQNTWTHITVTRSSSDVKFYINGELDNTVANTFTPNSGGTQDIIIGANGSGTPSYFNGKIGQVRAYSTELSLTEIRQNFNFTKAKYPNKFHGDINGATWNASGYFDFDGSNDFVDLDTSIGSTFWDNNWSASAWVYFDSTSAANQCIFTSHGLAYNYLYTNNNTQLRYSNDNGVTIATSSGTISAGQWHHIVVTRSSADGTVIYVDKVSVGTDSSSNNAGVSNASGAKPQIGAYTSTGSYPNQYPLDGRVSKFKLYNKALTQSEVDALYNEGQ